MTATATQQSTSWGQTAALCRALALFQACTMLISSHLISSSSRGGRHPPPFTGEGTEAWRGPSGGGTGRTPAQSRASRPRQDVWVEPSLLCLSWSRDVPGGQWQPAGGQRRPSTARSVILVGRGEEKCPQGPRGRAFYSGLPEVGREGPRTGVWGLTIRSFLSVCGGCGQQRCLHTRVSRTAPRSPNTVCPDGGGGPGSGAQGARGCGRGAPALPHQPGFKAGIAVPCKP